MITIYHNPRCSKSRGALERVQQFATEHVLELNIVDYQKTPLTLAQLSDLHRMLQSEKSVGVRDMMRDNEEIFSSLHLENADDATLLAAVAAHPILLQRPIVAFNGRAVIGRPVEDVESILLAS